MDRATDRPFLGLRPPIVLIRRKGDKSRGPYTKRCDHRDRIPERPPRILHRIDHPRDRIRGRAKWSDPDAQT